MKCSIDSNMSVSINMSVLPLVSVVIPLYNREKTVQRAVDSVLNQTYTNIEVIVVDDGSTDKSVDKLKKYEGDSRIRVFCQEKNRGANAARNRGIKESQGEYIAFQDSDDEWLPCKLEKQILYMINNGYLASFCSYRRHYGQNAQIIPEMRERVNHESLRKRLRKGNVVGTPTLVIHKQIVDGVGMFDEIMPRLQDYEFVIRIIKQFDMCYIDEPLVNEYQLNDSISLNQEGLAQAQVLLMKKHADFIDIESIWDEYLRVSGIINGESINWDMFDVVVDNIVEGNPYCTKEMLYKSTIESLYSGYAKIKNYEEHKYKVLLKYLENKKFVIYGAGLFGREVYYDLKKQGLSPQCFLVTTVNEKSCIDNIQICSLAEWDGNDMPVIIAVLGNAQIDIINELEKRDICNYYIYPFCL